MTVTEFPDFGENDSIAQRISLTGVFLLHGKAQIGSAANQVIAALGQFSTGNLTVTKPGYWIRITAQMAANTGTPFIKVDVQWSDSATGALLAEEKWFIPAGTTATLRTTGKGPVKGDRVNITFTNQDSAQSVTLSYNLVETTHAIARDDWRSSMGSQWTSTLANTSFARGDILGNVLMSDSPNIPGTTTLNFQLPLYAGRAGVFISDSAATHILLTAYPFADQDLALINNIVAVRGSADGTFTEVALPRASCTVALLNLNAGAVAPVVAITAMEYAS